MSCRNTLFADSAARHTVQFMIEYCISVSLGDIGAQITSSKVAKVLIHTPDVFNLDDDQFASCFGNPNPFKCNRKAPHNILGIWHCERK